MLFLAIAVGLRALIPGPIHNPSVLGTHVTARSAEVKKPRLIAASRTGCYKIFRQQQTGAHRMAGRMSAKLSFLPAIEIPLVAMVLITLRVRTNLAMLRVPVDDGLSVRGLKQEIQPFVNISASTLVVSREPKGAPLTDAPVLRTLGLKNGDVLFLHNTVSATPSAAGGAGAPSTTPLSSTASSLKAIGAAAAGKVVLQRGQIVSLDESKLEEAAPTMTPKCLHGPKGACEHCRPLEKKEDGTGPAPLDIEWLCTHPPHQMCTNCAPDSVAPPKKGSLCLHGPGAKCVHCIVPDDPLNRKHVSFEEFMAEEKSKCKHAPSTRCVHCIPPSEVSYAVRPGCTRHKPYPLGLCSDCQPPSVVLNRQKYRHVDIINVHQQKELERFVQFWLRNRVQRVAYLYGTFGRSAHGTRAIVEAIYEPPQISNPDGTTLVSPDPKEAHVNRIAAALGLERVGMIFTAPKLDCFLSSKSMRFLAQQQNKHRTSDAPGSRFASIAVMCDAAGGVEPKGCMSSDMLMALDRAGILGESKTDEVLTLRAPVGREYIPNVVGKADKTMDVEFFIVQMEVTVPKDAPPPVLATSQFPIENRGGFGEIQSAAAVKSYLDGKRRELDAFKFADFHLLVYLSELVDVETAVAAADCVRYKKPIPEGLTVILQAILG